MNAKYLLTGLAVSAAALAFAEDETEQVEAAESTDAVVAEAKAAPKQGELKPFTTLPLCRRVQGTVEILAVGAAEWTPAEEGRFYPLGTSYRSRGAASSLVLAFGSENTVSVSGDASFATRIQPLGEKSRTVILKDGKVEVSLARNLPEGLFQVVADGFVVKNLAGSSQYTYADKGDGFEASVKCVTGTAEVEGRHFTIPKMAAANAFTIRTSHDFLATILRGTSGDYVVKIDRGIATRVEIGEDGTAQQISEAATLDWHLSPETRVQINRARPDVGERMSVVVMTFDTAGGMKNHYAFAEGRAEVNSGELVPVPKAESDEIAKRAAEATEEKAADATEEKASDTTEESNN